MSFPTHETAATRRAAGALIHQARKQAKLSQRELAKRAGISETWLRGMTIGLGGDDPQRANNDIWLRLASAVRVGPTKLFATLGRPLPSTEELADVDDLDDDTEEDLDPAITQHMLETPVGRAVYEIVRDMARDTSAMSEEERAEVEEGLAERVRSDYTVWFDAKLREMERRRRGDA
ncbi:helix-turn-helix transcriptional regulator [Nocardiopsis sp. HUAS JQ3]|uniref:helix-turn-helix domain-containing protein n=1 Tax=Nocardiopsis sp. HUAS JQ3 TaxID=3061629 RepID=UPI0023A9FFC1|nr:helix-turn-helix transcriptional regulator [Nocardiopsis sp. HUAS JQ3]WDZ91175.1 helix-turn-helix transcriptional regulator [Nocardiopsis sp. HUAS JQ3]